MARGNQREVDREKAQKKLAASGKGKPKESATSLRARQEIDAAAMRAKNALALAKKAEGATAGDGQKTKA